MCSGLTEEGEDGRIDKVVTMAAGLEAMMAAGKEADQDKEWAMSLGGRAVMMVDTLAEMIGQCSMLVISMLLVFYLTDVIHPHWCRYGGGMNTGHSSRGGYGRDRGRDEEDRGEEGRRPVTSRPQIKLQPRSKNLDSPAETNSVSSPSAIFGGAKPVDTAAKELELEERRKKAEEERNKQRKEVRFTLHYVVCERVCVLDIQLCL